MVNKILKSYFTLFRVFSTMKVVIVSKHLQLIAKHHRAKLANSLPFQTVAATPINQMVKIFIFGSKCLK